ncbi:hypothetical protein EsH8_VII_000536 [Colletotrichum jinshuiense]
MSLIESSHASAAALCSSRCNTPHYIMPYRNEGEQAPRSSRTQSRRPLSTRADGIDGPLQQGVQEVEHALAVPYVDGGQPSQGRNAGGLDPFPPRPLAATLLAAKFSQAESRYLYHRLPMRQPPTTGTVRAHIGQLPALYRDLADGTRSALSVMEGREQERNRLLAALADGLAERYEGLVLCLPAGRVENIIRLNRGEERVSKFWERVLEQVEREDLVYIVSSVWVLLFVTQMSQVSAVLEAESLPENDRILIGTSVGLALLWAATVTTEVLSSVYVDRRRYDEYLHRVIARGFSRD